MHRKGIILIFLFCFSSLWAEPVAVTYSEPDQIHFGRDFSRNRTVRYTSADFKRSIVRKAGSPIITAVIISKETYDAIHLFAEAGEPDLTPRVYLYKNRDGHVVYEDRSAGILAEFECVPPPPELITHIIESYTNSYWQDIVLKEYTNSYIFRFYRGNDLDGDGIFSIKDALALSSLFGDKNQPLWGIHNGSGYLDNIYYSILSREYKNTEMYFSYRNGGENTRKLISLIKQIDSEYKEFPKGMYNTITGMIQYEKDVQSVIQLPENLLQSMEGDNLDFALLFYDLLTRKGYETNSLAVRTDINTEVTEYIVCFREQETFVWNAVTTNGLYEKLSENLEDIPALIYRRSLYYSTINPLVIMQDSRVPEIIEWERSEY